MQLQTSIRSREGNHYVVTVINDAAQNSQQPPSRPLQRPLRPRRHGDRGHAAPQPLQQYPLPSSIPPPPTSVFLLLLQKPAAEEPLQKRNKTNKKKEQSLALFPCRDHEA